MNAGARAGGISGSGPSSYWISFDNDHRQGHRPSHLHGLPPSRAWTTTSTSAHRHQGATSSATRLTAMQFHSTQNKNETAAFHEAILRGLPPDKGLYFPRPHPHAPPRDLDGR